MRDNTEQISRHERTEKKRETLTSSSGLQKYKDGGSKFWQDIPHDKVNMVSKRSFKYKPWEQKSILGQPLPKPKKKRKTYKSKKKKSWPLNPASSMSFERHLEELLSQMKEEQTQIMSSFSPNKPEDSRIEDTQKQKPKQVFVKSKSLFPVDLNDLASVSVKSIQEQIQTREGIPPDLQLLQAKGNILTDEVLSTLQHGDNIHVVVKGKGGMKPENNKGLETTDNCQPGLSGGTDGVTTTKHGKQFIADATPTKIITKLGSGLHVTTPESMDLHECSDNEKKQAKMNMTIKVKVTDLTHGTFLHHSTRDGVEHIEVSIPTANVGWSETIAVSNVWEATLQRRTTKTKSPFVLTIQFYTSSTEKGFYRKLPTKDIIQLHCSVKEGKLAHVSIHKCKVRNMAFLHISAGEVVVKQGTSSEDSIFLEASGDIRLLSKMTYRGIALRSHKGTIQLFSESILQANYFRMAASTTYVYGHVHVTKGKMQTEELPVQVDVDGNLHVGTHGFIGSTEKGTRKVPDVVVLHISGSLYNFGKLFANELLKMRCKTINSGRNCKEETVQRYYSIIESKKVGQLDIGHSDSKTIAAVTLHNAIENSRVRDVAELLRQGVDPNAPSSIRGEAGIEFACKRVRKMPIIASSQQEITDKECCETIASLVNSWERRSGMIIAPTIECIVTENIDDCSQLKGHHVKLAVQGDMIIEENSIWTSGTISGKCAGNLTIYGKAKWEECPLLEIGQNFVIAETGKVLLGHGGTLLVQGVFSNKNKFLNAKGQITVVTGVLQQEERCCLASCERMKLEIKKDSDEICGKLEAKSLYVVIAADVKACCVIQTTDVCEVEIVKQKCCPTFGKLLLCGNIEVKEGAFVARKGAVEILEKTLDDQGNVKKKQKDITKTQAAFVSAQEPLHTDGTKVMRTSSEMQNDTSLEQQCIQCITEMRKDTARIGAIREQEDIAGAQYRVASMEEDETQMHQNCCCDVVITACLMARGIQAGTVIVKLSSTSETHILPTRLSGPGQISVHCYVRSLITESNSKVWFTLDKENTGVLLSCFRSLNHYGEIHLKKDDYFESSLRICASEFSNRGIFVGIDALNVNIEKTFENFENILAQQSINISGPGNVINAKTGVLKSETASLEIVRIGNLINRPQGVITGKQITISTMEGENDEIACLSDKYDLQNHGRIVSNHEIVIKAGNIDNKGGEIESRESSVLLQWSTDRYSSTKIEGCVVAPELAVFTAEKSQSFVFRCRGGEKTVATEQNVFITPEVGLFIECSNGIVVIDTTIVGDSELTLAGMKGCSLLKDVNVSVLNLLVLDPDSRPIEGSGIASPVVSQQDKTSNLKNPVLYERSRDDNSLPELGLTCPESVSSENMKGNLNTDVISPPLLGSNDTSKQEICRHHMDFIVKVSNSTTLSMSLNKIWSHTSLLHPRVILMTCQKSKIVCKDLIQAKSHLLIDADFEIALSGCIEAYDLAFSSKSVCSILPMYPTAGQTEMLISANNMHFAGTIKVSEVNHLVFMHCADGDIKTDGTIELSNVTIAASSGSAIYLSGLTSIRGGLHLMGAKDVKIVRDASISCKSLVVESPKELQLPRSNFALDSGYLQVQGYIHCTANYFCISKEGKLIVSSNGKPGQVMLDASNALLSGTIRCSLEGAFQIHGSEKLNLVDLKADMQLLMGTFSSGQELNIESDCILNIECPDFKIINRTEDTSRKMTISGTINGFNSNHSTLHIADTPVTKSCLSVFGCNISFQSAQIKDFQSTNIEVKSSMTFDQLCCLQADEIVTLIAKKDVCISNVKSPKMLIQAEETAKIVSAEVCCVSRISASTISLSGNSNFEGKLELVKAKEVRIVDNAMVLCKAMYCEHSTVQCSHAGTFAIEHGCLTIMAPCHFSFESFSLSNNGKLSVMAETKSNHVLIEVKELGTLSGEFDCSNRQNFQFECAEKLIMQKFKANIDAHVCIFRARRLIRIDAASEFDVEYGKLCFSNAFKEDEEMDIDSEVHLSGVFKGKIWNGNCRNSSIETNDKTLIGLDVEGSNVHFKNAQIEGFDKSELFAGMLMTVDEQSKFHMGHRMEIDAKTLNIQGEITQYTELNITPWSMLVTGKIRDSTETKITADMAVVNNGTIYGTRTGISAPVCLNCPAKNKTAEDRLQISTLGNDNQKELTIKGLLCFIVGSKIQSRSITITSVLNFEFATTASTIPRSDDLDHWKEVVGSSLSKLSDSCGTDMEQLVKEAMKIPKVVCHLGVASHLCNDIVSISQKIQEGGLEAFNTADLVSCLNKAHTQYTNISSLQLRIELKLIAKVRKFKDKSKTYARKVLEKLLPGSFSNKQVFKTSDDQAIEEKIETVSFIHEGKYTHASSGGDYKAISLEFREQKGVWINEGDIETKCGDIILSANTIKQKGRNDKLMKALRILMEGENVEVEGVETKCMQVKASNSAIIQSAKIEGDANISAENKVMVGQLSAESIGINSRKVTADVIEAQETKIKGSHVKAKNIRSGELSVDAHETANVRNTDVRGNALVHAGKHATVESLRSSNLQIEAAQSVTVKETCVSGNTQVEGGEVKGQNLVSGNMVIKGEMSVSVANSSIADTAFIEAKDCVEITEHSSHDLHIQTNEHINMGDVDVKANLRASSRKGDITLDSKVKANLARFETTVGDICLKGMSRKADHQFGTLSMASRQFKDIKQLLNKSGAYESIKISDQLDLAVEDQDVVLANLKKMDCSFSLQAKSVDVNDTIQTDKCLSLESKGKLTVHKGVRVRGKHVHLSAKSDFNIKEGASVYGDKNVFLESEESSLNITASNVTAGSNIDMKAARDVNIRALGNSSGSAKKSTIKAGRGMERNSAIHIQGRDINVYASDIQSTGDNYFDAQKNINITAHTYETETKSVKSNFFGLWKETTTDLTTHVDKSNITGKTNYFKAGGNVTNVSGSLTSELGNKLHAKGKITMTDIVQKTVQKKQSTLFGIFTVGSSEKKSEKSHGASLTDTSLNASSHVESEESDIAWVGGSVKAAGDFVEKAKSGRISHLKRILQNEEKSKSLSFFAGSTTDASGKKETGIGLKYHSSFKSFETTDEASIDVKGNYTVEGKEYTNSMGVTVGGDMMCKAEKVTNFKPILHNEENTESVSVSLGSKFDASATMELGMGVGYQSSSKLFQKADDASIDVKGNYTVESKEYGNSMDVKVGGDMKCKAEKITNLKTILHNEDCSKSVSVSLGGKLNASGTKELGMGVGYQSSSKLFQTADDASIDVKGNYTVDGKEYENSMGVKVGGDMKCKAEKITNFKPILHNEDYSKSVSVSLGGKLDASGTMELGMGVGYQSSSKSFQTADDMSVDVKGNYHVEGKEYENSMGVKVGGDMECKAEKITNLKTILQNEESAKSVSFPLGGKLDVSGQKELGMGVGYQSSSKLFQTADDASIDVKGNYTVESKEYGNSMDVNVGGDMKCKAEKITNFKPILHNEDSSKSVSVSLESKFDASATMELGMGVGYQSSSKLFQTADEASIDVKGNFTVEGKEYENSMDVKVGGDMECKAEKITNLKTILHNEDSSKSVSVSLESKFDASATMELGMGVGYQSSSKLLQTADEASIDVKGNYTVEGKEYENSMDVKVGGDMECKAEKITNLKTILHNEDSSKSFSVSLGGKLDASGTMELGTGVGYQSSSKSFQTADEATIDVGGNYIVAGKEYENSMDVIVGGDMKRQAEKITNLKTILHNEDCSKSVNVSLGGKLDVSGQKELGMGVGYQSSSKLFQTADDASIDVKGNYTVESKEYGNSMDVKVGGDMKCKAEKITNFKPILHNEDSSKSVSVSLGSKFDASATMELGMGVGYQSSSKLFQTADEASIDVKGNYTVEGKEYENSMDVKVGGDMGCKAEKITNLKTILHNEEMSKSFSVSLGGKLDASGTMELGTGVGYQSSSKSFQTADEATIDVGGNYIVEGKEYENSMDVIVGGDMKRQAEKITNLKTILHNEDCSKSVNVSLGGKLDVSAQKELGMGIGYQSSSKSFQTADEASMDVGGNYTVEGKEYENSMDVKVGGDMQCKAGKIRQVEQIMQNEESAKSVSVFIGGKSNASGKNELDMSLGYESSSKSFQTADDASINVKGNYTIDADELESCICTNVGGDMTLDVRKSTFQCSELESCEDEFKIGIGTEGTSVKFGHGYSTRQSKTHTAKSVKVGKSLNLKKVKDVTFDNCTTDIGSMQGDVENMRLISTADKESKSKAEMHVGIDLVTCIPEFDFDMGMERFRKVNNRSAFLVRDGSKRSQVKNLSMAGSSIKFNRDVHNFAKNIVTRDVHEVETKFGVGATIGKHILTPEGMDRTRLSVKHSTGRCKSCITSDTGNIDKAIKDKINTNPEAQRQIDSKFSFHIQPNKL